MKQAHTFVGTEGFTAALGEGHLIPTILQSWPDLVLLANREGRYLSIAGNLELLFHSPEEVVGKTALEVLGPECGAKLIEQINEALHSGKMTYAQLAPVWDGSTVYLEVRIVPVPEDKVLIFSRNLSELRQMAQELADSRQRQNQILEMMPDLFLILDEAGYYREIFGNQDLNVALPEAMLNRHYAEILPPGAVGAYENSLAVAIATGGEVSGEIQMPTRQGLTPLEARLRVLENGQRMIQIRDISKRKEAEEALERQEQLSASILSMMPDLIVLLDKDGRCQNVRGNLAILKHSADWLMGKHVSEILPPEKARAIEGAMARCLLGEEFSKEAELELAGGITHIEYFMRYSEATGFIVVVRDITQRKLAEQAIADGKAAAERSNLAKSNFLAAMSHELRTPLNGVLGMAQILQDTDLDTNQKELLDVLMTSGKALVDIVSEILDLTRFDSPLVQLHLEASDLAEEMGTLARLYEGSAGAKGLEFKHSLAPEIHPQVLLDRVKFKQVLTHLLGNAIKFTDVGSVTLSVQLLVDRTTQQRLRFSVQDTGLGLTEEQSKIVFDPFYQADNSSTRRHGGAGIGLTLASKLVQSMGGEIQLKSQPGEGACFWFDLEMDKLQAPKATPAVSDLPVAQEASFRMLVVEDDPVNQMVIKQFLKMLGVQYDLANNGKVALDMMEQSEFHLILMDWLMPVMDGVEATKRLRQTEKGKNIPIIALTAKASAQDAQICLNAGMNEVMHKPLDFDRLSQTIQQYCHPSSLGSFV